jgi:hypothetical protein
MSLAELLPLIEGLSQSDRQQLMSFLAAQQLVEQKQIFSADVYPVWSPYDSFEAADLLAQMVKDDSHSFDVCFTRSQQTIEVTRRLVIG